MAHFLHCTVTATLRRFSSCDGEVSVSTDSDSSEWLRKKFAIEVFNRVFEVKCYANGNCSETEGNVSIIFKVIHFPLFNTLIRGSFSCTASVIDASGHKRFPQSFVLDCDIHSEELSMFTKSFGFQKYLKRSALLSDPPELLPGDSLTLHLEIEFGFSHHFISRYTYGWQNDENDNYYLRTDTEFFRDLCKMSGVLKRMAESPMVEKATGRILIPREEHISFNQIFLFLDEIDIHISPLEIYNLYLLADKYDMQRIVQLCRQLLTSALRAAMNSRKILDWFEESVPYISELAEIFEDESLRQILKIYSDIKNKGEFGTGELDASSASELVTGWNCEHIDVSEADNLMFSKSNIEYLERDIFV